MRIVSGTHKSRIIKPPANLPVRPTTDIAKEGLFNILANRIDFKEIDVLDLFAGTGSISYEFASRGVAHITAVDIEKRCVDFIRKASEEYGFNNIRTVRNDAFSFLKICHVKYDLIFADPPYEMKNAELLPELIFKKNILKENGLFILEHTGMLSFSKHPCFKEQRKYGKVNFSFFSNEK
ncbi:MAG: RsmD family RNA methyltransferase [Bacteroidota bacterium]